jgi:phosphomannomutase
MADADAISFGTDGWRATLTEFTDERLRMVGQAVADYLADEGATGPVVVGYDARETSPGFADSLAEVVSGNGFDVLVPERDCPTPLVAHAIVERDCAGALMVTASHNPPEYNGVKFIPGDGAPALPAVTEAVEARLAAPDLRPEAERGTVETVKPDPEPLLYALDSVGVAPDQALFVGDSDSDRVAAERAGMAFQWASDRVD